MLKKLLGISERIEDIIIQKPFDEAYVDKKFKKDKIAQGNLNLLHICAQHECPEAILYLVRKQNFDVNVLNANGNNALFIAIQYHSITSAKALLVSRININHTTLEGTTALHLCAKYNFVAIFDILKNMVKDIKQVDKQGRNILFYAVESKNIKMIKKVLEESNIDINHRDNQNNTISHLSQIVSDETLLNELLKMGLDLEALNNANEDFIYMNCLNLDLDEKLIEIALKKSQNLNKNYELRDNNILRKIINKILSIDIQVLENKAIISQYQHRLLTFIDYGIDINSLDEHGENILFDIIRKNNYLILEFILNKTQINIHQINAYKQNLLDIAIFYEKPSLDIIKLLIYSNLDCTTKDTNNHNIIEKLVDVILSEALPNRRRKIVNIKVYKNINYAGILNTILDYSKLDTNTLTFNNEPIIYEIAKSFYTPLLEMFKKYGANLNIINKQDKLNIFYKVLEAGKNVKDEKALFLKMLNFLVINNVNLDHKDSHGGTVLHKAILDHDLAVVNILTKKMNDYSAKDNKGRSYLHNCIWNGKLDILKKIAFKNRDLINIPDKFGLLPINYAVIMGEKEIVMTLIKLGAFLNNTNKINEQFKESFFSKLGKLSDLLNSSMTQNERALVTKLVQSMQKELNIE